MMNWSTVTIPHTVDIQKQIMIGPDSIRRWITVQPQNLHEMES